MKDKGAYIGKLNCFFIRRESNTYDMIYLLTAIGLSPGGRSTVHIYTQTIHRTTQQIWKSAGRATSWLVIQLAFALQPR